MYNEHLFKRKLKIQRPEGQKVKHLKIVSHHSKWTKRIHYSTNTVVENLTKGQPGMDSES